MGFWSKLFAEVLEERNEHEIDCIWAKNLGMTKEEKQTFYDLMYASRAAERSKRDNIAPEKSSGSATKETAHTVCQVSQREHIYLNNVSIYQTYKQYVPESEFKNTEGAEIRECSPAEFKSVLRERALKRLAEKKGKEAATEKSNGMEGEE